MPESTAAAGCRAKRGGAAQPATRALRRHTHAAVSATASFISEWAQRQPCPACQGHHVSLPAGQTGNNMQNCAVRKSCVHADPSTGLNVRGKRITAQRIVLARGQDTRLYEGGRAGGGRGGRAGDGEVTNCLDQTHSGACPEELEAVLVHP